MTDKKILTIQDISCFGQCSLTVALPIISACGVEAAILPSAVLSTHTGGFTGYTFRDLTDDIPAIAEHWKKEGLSFDAVYTGYLGDSRQIEYVEEIMDSLLREGGLRIVDPAMADHGKLYYGFDEAFVRCMAGLCGKADIILPNITEACFMTGTEYVADGYDEAYIKTLLFRLGELGPKTIVLTGVSYEKDKLGVAVYDVKSADLQYYFHERLEKACHGTGDVYASSFTGALMRGRSLLAAARLAADFTVEAMRKTLGDDSHWYGVKFEKALPYLIHELH